MREIKLNTIYRHFKGDKYLVMDICNWFWNRKKNGTI